MTKIWHLQKKMLGLCVAMLLPVSPGYAASQPLDGIASAAKTALIERAAAAGHSNVTVEIRPLDKRLKLPLCNKPLSTQIPASSQSIGAASVGVKCRGKQPWSIYVRAQVSATQSMPVLARAIARNSIIAKNDITITSTKLTRQNNGIVMKPAGIIGMEAARNLRAGAPVRVSDIRKPKIIKQGQLVTLVSSASNLEVKMQGKALGDAAIGERLGVTNLSSGKRIEGVAGNNGTVYVP